jgi:hypothetical protein
MTRNPGLPPTSLDAMAEEREEFSRFVHAVREEQLDAVEPLWMRRVFGKEELRRLWESLALAWDVHKHEYWWPLREGATPPNVITFHTDYFEESKVTAVREILTSHGIDRYGNSVSSASGVASRALVRSNRSTRAKRAISHHQAMTGSSMRHMSRPLRWPASG